jgi:hypothetical protein
VAATLDRLVADAQERLIYCALLVLRDEIEHFIPTEKDLDYPEKLRRALSMINSNTGTPATASELGGAASSALTVVTSSGTAAAAAAAAANSGDGGDSGDSGGGGHESLYASWYPPLRSTLVVLSKIYRAVDMAVFEDLAGEVK